MAFLLYALLVYIVLIAIAIGWARHCFRRPAPERDPHHRMCEVPHHVR